MEGLLNNLYPCFNFYNKLFNIGFYSETRIGVHLPTDVEGTLPVIKKTKYIRMKPFLYCSFINIFNYNYPLLSASLFFCLYNPNWDSVGLSLEDKMRSRTF